MDDLLTTTDVAAELGVSRAWVLHLEQAGRIYSRRTRGGSIRIFAASDVERLRRELLAERAARAVSRQVQA